MRGESPLYYFLGTRRPPMECPFCGSKEIFYEIIPHLIGDLPGTIKTEFRCINCQQTWDGFYKFSHTAY
jgi:DNA-directed RNA polymerase subunit M/transcription elongation factor TFIIS